MRNLKNQRGYVELEELLIGLSIIIGMLLFAFFIASSLLGKDKADFETAQANKIAVEAAQRDHQLSMETLRELNPTYTGVMADLAVTQKLIVDYAPTYGDSSVLIKKWRREETTMLERISVLDDSLMLINGKEITPHE